MQTIHTTIYHVTKIVGPDVWGHDERYCNDAGCGGVELFIAPGDMLDDVAVVQKGDIVSVEQEETLADFWAQIVDGDRPADAK